MKKFFVYFDKKIIINSVEEAEEFINSLTDKNERRKELAAMPKGTYAVEIIISILDHRTCGPFQDVAIIGCQAENGEDAYKKATEKLRDKYGDDLLDYETIATTQIIPAPALQITSTLL